MSASIYRSSLAVTMAGLHQTLQAFCAPADMPSEPQVPPAPEADDLTPRQREVLALQATPDLMAQLHRERPSGACVVCWRDLPSMSRLRLMTDPRLCYRRGLRPGSRSQPCVAIFKRWRREVERSTQASKASQTEVLHAR